MNAILVGKKIHFVKASEMYDQTSNTVDNMTGLGFTGDYVGTHSICSALAMALYLSKQLISTIMLLDQWSSDAFLL